MLCVASGIAAVAASAGYVCPDEAIQFPGGQMTMAICSQAFKCHLVEQMCLEKNRVEASELYMLYSCPLRIAFLPALRRAEPTHQAVLQA